MKRELKRSRLGFKKTIRKYERGLRVTKHRVKMCLIEVSEVEERDWAEAQFEERKPNFPELTFRMLNGSQIRFKKKRKKNVPT